MRDFAYVREEPLRLVVDYAISDAIAKTAREPDNTDSVSRSGSINAISRRLLTPTAAYETEMSAIQTRDDIEQTCRDVC